MTSRLHQFIRGIRVLDLSRHLPGPLATLMLADMGADVLKIESPAGDEMRSLGPVDAQGRAVLFEAVNAGKRVCTIDLKTQEGREALLTLADTADVLVESFRPGVMDRLGVGHQVLRRRNPRLICCALTGYGQDGPLRDMAGHDVNYLSRAGVLFANGNADAPSMVFPPIADCTASMYAANTILGALLGRAADGQGCTIDIALADVVTPFQVFALAEMGLTGKSPTRQGEWLNGGWACYQIYETADGRHISVGAIEAKFWRSFCDASGRPDWVARQAASTPQTDLTAEVAALVRTLTLAECMVLYEPADCCVTAVLDLASAVDSPYVQTRGLVMAHPQLPIFQASYPAIVDGKRPAIRPPLASESAG